MTEESKCSCKTSEMTTEKHQAKHLAWVGAVVVIVTALSLWLSPYFFVEDTNAIYRYMILKVPPIFINMFALLTGLVLADFLTESDSLDCINKDPMATSVLYSAFLIALGVTIAFG